MRHYETTNKNVGIGKEVSAIADNVLLGVDYS